MTEDKKPLVTVITITFNIIKSNREKSFRQCVESVHNQSYPNLEHIIIDGASTDGSLDLINEYVKKGWVKLFSEPDKGIYDAMNKGIKKASGKYINFLHTDDFFHNKKAVELSIDALEQNRADYSYADTQGINAKNDKPIEIWHGNINLIPFGTHYCHQSMFIKTSLLKELGGFDISHRISADSDLMVKLVSLNKKYVYIPETIVSYRSGGLSNVYSRETRKEHSRAFYNYLGKNLGMTQSDCFLIWNFSIFNEKSILYCLNFGKKLKITEWKREYYRRFYSFHNFKNQLKRFLPEFLLKPLLAVKNLVNGKK